MAQAGAVTSQALAANFEQTRAEVVIPPSQRVLLEITAPLVGVHQQVEHLLRELNHPFIGWAPAIDELHARALGDFFHFHQHARGAEALAVLGSFYQRAAREANPPELRAKALRHWLLFLEKLAGTEDEHAARNLALVGEALRDLRDLCLANPQLAVLGSARLRKLVLALARRPRAVSNGVFAEGLGCLSHSLQAVYRHWLAHDDPADWYRGGAEAAGLRVPKSLPAAVQDISHARLADLLRQAESLGAERAPDDGAPGPGREPSPAAPEAGTADWPELNQRLAALETLPDQAVLTRAYLRAASAFTDAPLASLATVTGMAAGPEQTRWAGLVQRLFWLFKVLAAPALEAIHEEALRDINATLVDVVRAGDRAQLADFVRRVFAVLREGHFPFLETVLDSIRTIGLEVIATRDQTLVEIFVDELIAFAFQHPRLEGVTEEWQVRVNPAHVKCIRTYLALIAADTMATRRLLSALVINLKLGGVFVADTDLFQKDISSLLNAAIAPVYHQVKHLLKLFPVYFSEIGAEGETRDVSTRLDEIRHRRDPLCHFIRKQCHVESNPLLVSFLEGVARFWATGDKEGMRGYLPEQLWQSLDIDQEEYAGLHRVFSTLAARPGRMGPLFGLGHEELQAKLAAISGVDEVAREKAALLLRLHHLVHRKYNLDHGDLLAQLRAANRFEEGLLRGLQGALDAGDHSAALEILLEVLEQLKRVVLDPARSEGREDIYHKRHIAVGIPSMYGTYREEKFEAIGLTFRVESLAKALFDKMLAAENLTYITRSTLQRVAGWLRLFLRALRVDGFRVRGLEMRIEMLEKALGAHGITVDQYINIFQFLQRNVENLIRVRFLDVYETNLDRIVPRLLREGVLRGYGQWSDETVFQIAESFLRDLIATSFGLQALDNLSGRILQTLANERGSLDRPTLNLLMSYDVRRCFSPISIQESPYDDLIYLGNKGLMLKRLAAMGFPIPPGFVLTTEVFRCLPAILAHDELREENVGHIVAHIARLEAASGKRFGDPDNPLILSVRSGAAMSMPGMLETFLNVGMNPDIAEGFARRTRAPWLAWDSYRRFLQLWGMSFGMARDDFDGLMSDAKARANVAKKAFLPPERMRDLAMHYRDAIRDHGIEIVDDPQLQLRTCIDQVLSSWSTDKARVYRQQMQIAEEWGTAVIVQAMIYGNKGPRSGTGVLFTAHPQQRSEDVSLYGDFIIQGQGEDVVAGLVGTYPISERQRLGMTDPPEHSLERDFPEIHGALVRHATALVHEYGMAHQEIEFTFEGPTERDLYLLQTRDMVMSEGTNIPTFVPTHELELAKVATGIGGGGGALCGRVAFTEADIASLRAHAPDDEIILVRPDTVPEDLRLVFQCQGLLTALGGATSHAAVAAQRLGRTSVLGCRSLKVYEREGTADLAGHQLRAGDRISINGLDGSIYLGFHEIKMARLDAFMRR